jgi:hypothetical protein
MVNYLICYQIFTNYLLDLIELGIHPNRSSDNDKYDRIRTDLYAIWIGLICEKLNILERRI